jgi:hypothetical protein
MICVNLFAKRERANLSTGLRLAVGDERREAVELERKLLPASFRAL